MGFESNNSRRVPAWQWAVVLLGCSAWIVCASLAVYRGLYALATAIVLCAIGSCVGVLVYGLSVVAKNVEQGRAEHRDFRSALENGDIKFEADFSPIADAIEATFDTGEATCDHDS